jgi:DNA gyrase subunit B
VLNVEKAKLDKLLKNNEISALIAATGVDIENVEDVSKVRYGKVIILTDADVDGQHIRTLLLTFFFRQMRKLVEEGHVYVARPPLYKVTHKKETRFVQTRDEMVKELTARGLKDTVLHIQALNGHKGRDVSASALAKLLPVLSEIETAVVDLERRGHSLESFMVRVEDGVLPSHHVRVLAPKADEKWFAKTEQVTDFLAKWKDANGRESVLGNDYTLDDWHEVRVLNRALVKLRESGFEPNDLVALQRVAGREPPVRFIVEHGEARKELPHLRTLVTEIRHLGEKGITVTRFKGLGEMAPEELWETTLDPVRRTLLKVTLNDALAAEREFRRLMGEDAESRRDFIFKERLTDPDEIDYGGA